MKKTLCILLIVTISIAVKAQGIEEKIDSLISKMTLEEKIGQLNQLSYDTIDSNITSPVENGNVGCILNELDAKIINAIQKVAV